MTPGTRLLEAARAWLDGAPPDTIPNAEERALEVATRDLGDARALYPAAHAIGDQVLAEENNGSPAGLATVIAIRFTVEKVNYKLRFEDTLQKVWFDAAYVHPAPRTLPLYRAPGVSGGPDWTVEEIALNPQPAPSWFPMDGRRVAEEDAINRFITEELPRRRAEFVSTLPDVAREVYAAATGVTEGSPGEAPYEPVTDKDRREAIARAVIRSKPGPEGGACDIDYRAAALVLFQLLDDIDTLDDACRENDVAFRRLAMVKARRREDVGASFDGYTVAFIGERAYAEGEKRTSKPSRAEESPTSSIADVQKATFDPAVHGNGVPGFGSTNTLLIPNRVKITRHTDEHGVKTTETVDLRDPDDLHARFAEALGQEWRKLEGDKDVRHEWLAAFERAVEIAGDVWAKG